MHQIYSVLTLFLLLFKGGVAVSKIVKEGDRVEIQCDPKQERMILWFRMHENQPVNFIASFSGATLKSGTLGKLTPSKDGKQLVISTFDKKTDAGAYSCASINNNQLFFGEATYLSGQPDPKPKENTPAPTTRAPSKLTTTKTTTACKSKETKLGLQLGCELKIFIPLVAGCGVLFLLLLITILYCNHIRTRRCPHHYKRQPRGAQGGHKPLPNPHSF